MKVKKFNNLWAMGLILCGVLLVAFYVIKIFFPEFIIGIAETPRLVEIGTTIQANKWYLHLFNFVTGFIDGYIICCACCRTYKLNWKGTCILLSALLILRLVSEFYPTQYISLNCASLVIVPFIICFANKNINKETFISTIMCFLMDLGFQFFSLVVRNLTIMTLYPNIVSILVMLIDVFIWRVLLYLYFNNKKESNKNGN